MKNKKQPRLKPRATDHFEFVFNKEISDFHGKVWYKKFCKVAGVNTCPFIQDIPKEFIKYPYVMYYWDYLTYSNYVDYKTPFIKD